MKKNLTTLLLLSLLYFNYSCNKDDIDPHGLPAATESGENTFGCLVDGEPWIAEIGLGVFAPSLHKLVMGYDETETGVFYNNIWSLTATYVTADSTNDFFFLGASRFTEPSCLNQSVNHLRATFWSSYDRPFVEYKFDSLLPYQVSITKLDEASNICSGKFDFYAISTDTNKSDTLHITEGRFDVKYNPE
ncbi:MAG: hypothetical protein ACJAT4_001487 [Granulosicoccus sp.]|jgi:hypothetical protein